MVGNVRRSGRPSHDTRKEKRMLEQTIICDRCGKECEESRNNRGFHIFRNKFYLKNTKDDYLDLCQKCYDGLAKWMKERANDI